MDSGSILNENLTPDGIEGPSIEIQAPRRDTPDASDVETFVTGEVFDPAVELSKIKALPKEERKSALEIYKEKLVAQTIGAGQMRAEIAGKMRDPYELMDNELELLHRYQKDYCLPPSIVTATEGAIERAHERKLQIAEAMVEFSRPELIQQILGFTPNGVVRLGRRGITINLYFQDSRDYALFATGFPGQKVRHKELEHVVHKSAGYFRSELEAPKNRRPYDGMVIGINDIDPALAAITQLHEEQHAVNELLNPLDISVLEPLATLPDSIQTLDADEQEAVFEAAIKSSKSYAFARAKDEILAIMTENFRNQSEILDSLSTPYSKGGFNDYTLQARKTLNKILKKDESYEKYQKQIKDSLIKQHKETINQAVDALFKLTEITSANEAIGILEGVPLEHWSKAYSRIKRYHKTENV